MLLQALTGCGGDAGVKGRADDEGVGAVSQAIGGITVRLSPPGASLPISTAQQFQATVTGTANTAVLWSVDGLAGGNATSGTITTGGLYTAPAARAGLGVVTVSAQSAADGLTQASVGVTIQDPAALGAARLLDQATFGPTAALIHHVEQVGYATFLDEQMATPESSWPPLATAQRWNAVDAFFANAVSGQDQLRQRVIFALSEFLVIAMNKNTNGDELVPWLSLLSRNAFGNYRTLLRELTLDASMGKYLDLANSDVGNGTPNENYAREVMQLFSIGIPLLNPDGSPQLDPSGQPIPAFTQADVAQLARALTGWTYGNATGIPPTNSNTSYYPGPMLPLAARHNPSSKTILGHTLAAGRSIVQDLDDVIDILFNHPNTGPFVATRLIRALVTSNPSPAYVARVAARFNNNGQQVRGDLPAVLRAILLDPEARNDTPPATFGRLRTPMQHTAFLARTLGIDPGPASQFAYLFYGMDEGLLDAASVFGHYSPFYRIPSTTLVGPEFQIYSASDAINRANWFYQLIYAPYPMAPALQPFLPVAGNATNLINAVSNAILFGRMSDHTRAAIATSLPVMPDDSTRVLGTVYLALTSGEGLVQR